MNNAGGARKATPRGQTTRGGNSGPAVMLMPPDIRSTFMPNPPLANIPRVTYRRKQKWTGVTDYLSYFEKGQAPSRTLLPTPQSLKEERKEQKQLLYLDKIQPKIDVYRREQRECGGEYDAMNCYNTLFVGRLAYEVTERKLLREMEAFGRVKDIKIVYESISDDQHPPDEIKNKKKSRGYAFVEYEHEEDMKRAYRAADGMRIEGREIVVDVERGHTVPSWLPRRLGGGLGGTRLGGRDMNVTRPGRFDPQRMQQMEQMSHHQQHHQQQQHSHMMGPPGAGSGSGMHDGMGRGSGGGGPPSGGGGGPPRFGGYGSAPPQQPVRGRPGPPGPPPMGMGRGAPPPNQMYGGGGGGSGGPDWDRDRPPPPNANAPRGDNRDFRKRQRSRSPEQRYGGGGGGRRR